MKAQQRMDFLFQLRKLNLLQQQLIQFSNTAIQSLLCASVIVWIGLAPQRGQEQTRTEHQARRKKKMVPTRLPFISRLRKQAGTTLYTIGNPHILDMICFSFSPQRGAICLNSKTMRHKNNLFPQGITLLNLLSNC